MSDLLIKNMEMPVDHGIFIVICPSGTIEQKVGTADNGYPIYHIVKDAKAVALPSHGRLGDLDALIESLWCEQEDVYAEQIIKSAPTIVEATE